MCTRPKCFCDTHVRTMPLVVPPLKECECKVRSTQNFSPSRYVCFQICPPYPPLLFLDPSHTFAVHLKLASAFSPFFSLSRLKLGFSLSPVLKPAIFFLNFPRSLAQRRRKPHFPLIFAHLPLTGGTLISSGYRACVRACEFTLRSRLFPCPSRALSLFLASLMDAS